MPGRHDDKVSEARYRSDISVRYFKGVLIYKEVSSRSTNGRAPASWQVRICTIQCRQRAGHRDGQQRRARDRCMGRVGSLLAFLPFTCGDRGERHAVDDRGAHLGNRGARQGSLGCGCRGGASGEHQHHQHGGTTETFEHMSSVPSTRARDPEVPSFHRASCRRPDRRFKGGPKLPNAEHACKTRAFPTCRSALMAGVRRSSIWRVDRRPTERGSLCLSVGPGGLRACSCCMHSGTSGTRLHR